MIRPVLTWSIVLAMAAAPAVASACASFGNDAIPVFEVQKSWGPAEQFMAAGRYAAAVTALQGTSEHLASIRNGKTRTCVAEGENLRLVSAKAGFAYLAAHPRDRAGAKQRADEAWRAFPMHHDCP